MKKTPKTGDKASKKVAGTPQVSKENQTPSNVKTPVSKKSAKKESKKDGLVLKHDSQLPDKPVLAKFVSALMQVDRKVSEKDGKQLFDEDGIPLALQITGIKLPRDDRKQMIKVRLPHCVIQPPRDVCLITKDLKKGLKEDHEDSVNHFKDLMEEKGVSNDLVSEVISLRQLKVEYKQYESKLSLVKRYDIFLADTRIMRLIPKFLGKPFYARKKFPVPINLRADNLKQEVQKGIDTVILPLSHHGTTSRVVFGNSKMSESDLTENLMALVEAVGARYPGGVKNIRSLHIKTDVSPAIPIHVNTASGNDLGFVDADIPNKVSRETVTGELSTQPGMEVTITPHGTIKVKKTGDPLWDDEKDEPFVSGSEEEGEEEEDKDAKAKKEQPKKRKVDAAAPADKKKAKKAKKDSDSDSEEEDIKESEKAYIKRAQKDDEQEEKLTKKQKKEAKKAKSEPVKEVEQTPSKKSKKEEKVANKQKDEKVADAKKQKDSKKTDKPVKKPVEQSEPETPKAKGKQATKEPKKSPKEEESDDEWTDASDSDENEASGDENEGSGDEVSELEFTDGSDDDDEDDDDDDSDEGDESRITEVYDDQQELDAKDVIVDSDDDSDGEDASDDRIMLDPKLRGQAEAASDSGEEEETPKKGKKLTKNQKRKQRQEEKSSSKPQQKQKKSSKQQSPVQNKKPAKQQSPAQNKKPAGKKPVPVKPASSKGKPGKKR